MISYDIDVYKRQLSSLYIVVLGVYETAQGFKPDHQAHLKFGIVILVLSLIHI